MAAYDDFFDLLHDEHTQVKDMLNRLKETSSKDHAAREEQFNRLTAALIPHMKGEEKAFYPVLRQHKAAQESAMEAMEEHHAAELILNELTRMSKQEEFWGPKLSVFREIINHHIQEEESRVFSASRSSLSEDQMKDIMKNYQKEKQAIQSQAMASQKM